MKIKATHKRKVMTKNLIVIVTMIVNKSQVQSHNKHTNQYKCVNKRLSNSK